MSSCGLLHRGILNCWLLKTSKAGEDNRRSEENCA